MRRRPVIERFSEKLLVMPSGCWNWTAAKNEKGYGTMWAPFPSGELRTRRAHRVAYEIFVGPIPAGFQIDHLCRNKACVNPSHLEPVVSRENTMRGNGPTAENARKTHCKHGHPFDEANTGWNRTTGWRCCRACKNAGRRLKRQLKSAEENAKQKAVTA